MDTIQAQKEALTLVNASQTALLGLNDEGFPNIRAMLKMENEGLKTIWFSTNTSSKKIQQIAEDPRSCVYFWDSLHFKGLKLFGKIEVLTDLESKRRLWRKGFEMYYPKGVDDPDYSVLRFVAHQGNYYHNLANVTFDL